MAAGAPGAVRVGSGAAFGSGGRGGTILHISYPVLPIVRLRSMGGTRESLLPYFPVESMSAAGWPIFAQLHASGVTPSIFGSSVVSLSALSTGKVNDWSYL